MITVSVVSTIWSICYYYWDAGSAVPAGITAVPVRSRMVSAVTCGACRHIIYGDILYRHYSCRRLITKFNRWCRVQPHPWSSRPSARYWPAAYCRCPQYSLLQPRCPLYMKPADAPVCRGHDHRFHIFRSRWSSCALHCYAYGVLSGGDHGGAAQCQHESIVDRGGAADERSSR